MSGYTAGWQGCQATLVIGKWQVMSSKYLSLNVSCEQWWDQGGAWGIPPFWRLFPLFDPPPPSEGKNGPKSVTFNNFAPSMPPQNFFLMPPLAV